MKNIPCVDSCLLRLGFLCLMCNASFMHTLKSLLAESITLKLLPLVIFGRKLKRLLKDYYCTDVKVVFSSFKVKNYFFLKCHTPMPLMANVVYQFTCLRDANSTYIGKTVRHLATRVKEHATSSSAIKEHLSSCTTCKDNYSCNSFKVIDSANSDFEVSIKEALHIKHRNPNLNKQLSTQGMSFMLKIFT